METLYDLEDLPELFEGTGPNITGDFYPPNMNQHKQTMLTQDEAADLASSLANEVIEEFY